MKNNVTLIGMPGAGKSTVGVILAKLLGYDFIDSDLLIQKAEGKRLWEIMRDEGTEAFTRIEERVNSEIHTSCSVIATGGSTVYSPKAMKHLREISTVVYLRVTYPVLKRRLGDLTRRGVVLKPDQTLENLYEERIPLYEKYAHVTVNISRKSVQQSALSIIAALEKENI